MKKLLYTIGSVLALCISVNAQNRVAGNAEGTLLLNNNNNNSQLQAALLCDTISNLNVAGDTATVYSNTGTGNWGYVSGHNSYKDAAKAEKFSGAAYTGGYQLAGGIFYFYKAAGDSVSTIQLAAWEDDGANGYPSTLLTTTTVQISSLQTGMSGNVLMFQTPPPVSGDFYLGINGFQYTAPQKDTVALYTGTKYATANTAYEQWIDGSWHAFSEVNNWNLKLHFFMVAILCNTDVGTYEILNPTDELIVFPNPSSGEIYFSTGKNAEGSAIAEIFDATGKSVAAQTIDLSKSKTHKLDQKLAAGVYMLRVQSASRSMVKRVLVN